MPGRIRTVLTFDAGQQVTGLRERYWPAPSQRLRDLEHLADIAVFLASPASDFITDAADTGRQGLFRDGYPLSEGGSVVLSVCMSTAEQLDLFSQSADREEQHPHSAAARSVIACDSLDDDGLVAALLNAGIRESIALAEEVARRRLAPAIPALEALCRRFAGFGADRIVPEQAAALDALAAIGGSKAAQALVRLIAKGVVQGPSLQRAVSAAARLRARMPAALVLELLQHRDPQIRADACRCVRASPEAAVLLHDLLDDLHPYVQMAAACALGRHRRREVRPFLLRFLREKPSTELIDAIAGIADEECVILLGRVADARPDLSQAVLDALDGIDHPRVEKIASQIRRG